MAYCTNIAYSVVVNHASPISLGQYESTGIEPLSYKVSGSFTVIRYAADAKSRIGAAASPGHTSEGGNGIGNWGEDGYLERAKAGLKLSGADGRVYDSLNPVKLEKATGFEINIYQKIPDFAEQVSVTRIRDARITRADFNLSKKSVATQTFNFTALYVDEDSFLADFSGSGQQFD